MKRPRLLASLALLAAAACGKPKDATPAGTTVLDWTTANASRATIPTAKIGARKAQDAKVVWTTAMGDKVEMTLHVETAPVEFDEGKEHVSQTSPVAVAMKVTANDKLALKGSCDGPNYQMPSVGADGGFVTPQGMLLDCNVNATLGPSNDILSFRVDGAGKVEPWGVGGKVDIR